MPPDLLAHVEERARGRIAVAQPDALPGVAIVRGTVADGAESITDALEPTLDLLEPSLDGSQALRGTEKMDGDSPVPCAQSRAVGAYS